MKSTEAWIENTSRLLADPADYDSSKTLSHHASTLQVSVLPVFPGCHRIYIMISGLADCHNAFFPPSFLKKQPYLQACQMAEGSLEEWQALDRDFGDQDLVLSVLITNS